MCNPNINNNIKKACYAISIPITITLVHACNSNTDIGILYPYLRYQLQYWYLLTILFNLKTIAIVSPFATSIPISHLSELAKNKLWESAPFYRFITMLALKLHKKAHERFVSCFLIHGWSKNHWKEKTLNLSLIIEKSWKISSSFFTEAS